MDLIDYPCEMGSGVECCTRVDLPAIDPPAEPTAGPERAIVIGPELFRAGSRLFLEARDSLENSSSPASWDTAREAHMAGSLTRLLAQGDTVMWVGGMAHWTRILARNTSDRRSAVRDLDRRH
jgi:hypothetical protein